MNKHILYKKVFLAILGISFLFMSLSIIIYFRYIPGVDSVLKGKGTENNPYLIEDIFCLRYLRDKVSVGEDLSDIYFLQTSDIDLGGENWIPIGKASEDRYFKGIYDGGCHSIKNLNIDFSEECGGLFGAIDGTIKNLCIIDANINCLYAGAIASQGASNANIINCYVKGNIKAEKRAGGICDNLNSGKIINCIFLGELDAPMVGGISSYNASLIYHSYSNNDIYNDNYDGSILNKEDTLKTTELSDIYKYLNDGIDTLEKHEIIEVGQLSRWE